MDGKFEGQRSVLAGADVERVLSVGAYDRRCRLYDTIEGKLDVLRVEYINAIKISAASQKPTEF
jgi:hypothetical protein